MRNSPWLDWLVYYIVNSVSDFNQDGKKDNITFMVKRIKVHTLEALKDPSYRFPNNYGVEKFLELFSGELLIFVVIIMEQNFNA